MKRINRISRNFLIVALLAFFIVITLLSLVGCESQGETNSSYEMSLDYNHDGRVLRGSEKVRIVNNTDNSFSNYLFHLYPNAFRQGAKRSLVTQNDSASAYPNGESWGNIEILGVSSGEKKLEYIISGEDENILNITLPQELYPNESVEVTITFNTYLANINHRLGYGDNTINFGNFYPIMCVYEEGKGFATDLYHSNGDPFYSEVADYDVTITFDRVYTLASTGNVTKEEEKNDRKQIRLTEDNVRDFAFSLSEKFEKRSKLQDKTTVNYYGYKDDDNIDEILNICAKALETFNDTFGSYPYNQLSIVKSNFLHGGMEFPGIVLVSDQVTQRDFPYVCVHEIAHQWWYGVVGNDQYNHAWLDEALAEYSTLIFFEKNPEFGEDFDELVKAAEESYCLFEKVFIEVTGSVDGRMDRPLDQFNSQPEYTQCTYCKGVLMLDSLRQSVGDRKFFKALKDYYKDFAYSLASPADFIASFSKSTGYELEGYINSWINGKTITC